ncbi:FAD-binding protein [Spirochaetia bacterium]|nr:FAD-binding protein [Spirochaetia bacterium]
MSEARFLGKEVIFDETIFDCLIVGSGAAGFNAALHLFDKGVTRIAIVTENRLAGTSRNTGSDKQTYYKIACAGDQKDSPRAMAETLFAGASMDGDLALCEASHSLQEFFHLVSIGVEFPHNRYGEFAGYKTDHDPLQRASSIGPYTSKMMTERLEAEVQRRNINIIDKTRAVKLLVDAGSGQVFGLLALERGESFRVYFSKNIIFASGGNPGLYRNTVYPPSQFGSSGIMVREGVRFANMTEWQYGIASTKFRWNLSGSYQQVIPRYVAIDENGNEEEFLSSYFSSVRNLGRAVFLKGYQWPFDPEKIGDEGSSLVDLAIYIEKHINGKRIFIDYTRNPRGLALDDIDAAAREYLAKSNALAAAPVDRLLALNSMAYDLYKSHGIDLAKEYLEIDVVPQHHNGGAEVDIWWETSIKHLFAAGECAGTHGVRRPGGSALNAGQVGGYRAACRVAGSVRNDVFFEDAILKTKAVSIIEEFGKEFANVRSGTTESGGKKAGDLLISLQEMNSRAIAFIRSGDGIETGAKALEAIAREPVEMPDTLTGLFNLREIILMSRLMYSAVLAFIQGGGKSRGSCLVVDSIKNIRDYVKGVEIDTRYRDKILNTAYIPGVENRFESSFRTVRPIPKSDTWFEEVWREYREGKFFSEKD